MGMITQTANKYDEARARSFGDYHPSETPPDWLSNLYGWPLNSNETSGVVVNKSTALNYSAVFACIRVIAETGGATPFPFYGVTDRGKNKLFDDSRYALSHNGPNPEMTSYQYVEMGLGHMATWGNFYSEIIWKGATPDQLWPLDPSTTRAKRMDDGSLFYVVKNNSGRDVALPARNVLHIPWMTYDGITGYSPIDLARKSIGAGMAAQEFAGRFWSNDARPGGYLKHPGKLSKPAQENLRQNQEKRRNLTDKHRMDIYEEGLEWVQVGIPPEAAQFLETREFDINDIARWYNVPPHKIQDLRRATFTNIEHQSIEFIRDTMRPWYARWEQQWNKKLLTDNARKRFFWEFNVDGQLRGDIKTRYEAYWIGRQGGWLNANEIRTRENMNLIDGPAGDDYWAPSNMQPSATLQAPQGQQENARTLFPILEDGIARLNRREAKDGDKLDVDKHREHIREVMTPYAETHKKLLGSDWNIDEYIDDRIKKLGG